MPDGAVHAIGPDGKHYQFPAGYTPEQVQNYFKSPEQRAAAVASQPATGDAGTPPSAWNPFSESTVLGSGLKAVGLSDVSGSDVLHALGMPGSMDEARQQSGYMAEHPFETLWRNIKGTVIPGGMGRDILTSMGKQGIRAAQTPGDDPMRSVRALSALNPLAAPVTEQMDEARDRGQPGEATAAGLLGAGGLALGLKSPATPEELLVKQRNSLLRQMTKQQIIEQAHAKLNSQVEPTQRLIRDVPLQNMRTEVGQHVAGIDAADVAQSPGQRPSVNTTSLHPLLDDITNTHRSSVNSSRFQQAIDEVNNLPAQSYWKDVHDAKMNVRSLWAKAAEGTPEKSALNKLSEGMEDILGNRADEIGQTKQYNKYRELTKAYHAYESTDNVVGKLLNANLGRDFFSILRDPAYADQLSAASKDFGKYGLPEDTLSRLSEGNAELYNRLQSQKAGKFGKIKAITQEPLAALIGMTGGQWLGTLFGHPTLGGLIGAMKGADLAETYHLRNILAQQGLAPSRELISGRVEPGPAGPGAAAARAGGGPDKTPTPSGPAIDPQKVSDVVGAIRDLGWKVSDKMAESIARQELTTSGGDVGKAVDALAARGKTAQQVKSVSGGSQSAAKTESTPTAEGREAQAEAARAGSKYMSPSPKGKGTAKQGIEETEEGRRLIAKRLKRGKK